ncbi:MAG: STAS/SEC14 domain-containing protein [Mesorhizobium sp.]
MNFLEDVPVVRRIDTNRDDLFAVELVGHVRAPDAENLFGLFEAACAQHPRIDVLVRLVDHDGVDWADIAADTLKQGSAEAVDHVGRCAIIGESNWSDRMQGWLAAPSTVEIRHFPADSEADAWAWLDAHEKPADV